MANMDSGATLGIMLFIGIGACLIALAIYMERKRREMWQSVAQRYGLTFYQYDPHEIPKRYHEFALFQRGHSRKASNCLEGSHDGRHVLLFDYRFTTGSGKHKQTHRLSAMIARLDLHCPHLVIRPESFFDKIGDMLGFADIDFEYDEFNRRFHVKCPNKKFAYDICHSGMINYLMDHGQLTWEMCGDCVLLYGLGQFDPKEIDYCLGAMHGFVDQFPAYLRKGSVHG